MKKFAALLLALTMVLGMATITASAEGSERVITIGTTWDLYWDSFDGSIEDNPYYSGTTADEMMFAKVKQIEEKWNVKFEYINLTYAGAKESINTYRMCAYWRIDGSEKPSANRQRLACQPSPGYS